MVQISFHGEATFEEENLALSLLDIALKHGIPHSHICGRATVCSSCRVEILEHPENVFPPGKKEKEFATRFGWPPGSRMACQTYLKGPVTVRRLTRDVDTVEAATRESIQFAGSQLKLAIMFTDIRGFTSISERHPTYDIFYILNRYYQIMGESVLRHRGYIHQYYGDGMMALFGFYARDPHQICLDAVSCGLDMLDALPGFNRILKKSLGEEISIGIGIHFGEVIAGRIGHSGKPMLNVLGDVVNLASRIQDASKQADSPLVISSPVYWELGGTVVKVNSFTTVLRGKTGEQRLYEVQGFAPGYKSRKRPAIRAV